MLTVAMATTAAALVGRCCRRRLLQPAWCRTVASAAAPPSPPPAASNQAQRQHRLTIFQEEQERQLRLRRDESADAIEVAHAAGGKLTMQLGVSTPMDVARQLDDRAGPAAAPSSLAQDSVLALVNGSSLVHMHRPLRQSCSIRFLRLHQQQAAPAASSREEAAYAKACNVALWHSGAMLMGSVMETAFRQEYTVKLISSPPPFLPSGSFIYDCQVTKTRSSHSLLRLDSGHCLAAWSPSRAELRALSRAALPALAADEPFEPLDLPLAAALEMFRHNDCKAAVARRAAAAGAAAAAANSPATGQQQPPPPQPSVTVYRVGDFVDLLSPGPVLARTGQIGLLLVAAVHRVESADYGPLARAQGVAFSAAAAAHADAVDAALERAAAPNATLPPTRRAAPAAPAAAARASTGGGSRLMEA